MRFSEYVIIHIYIYRNTNETEAERNIKQSK